MRLGCAGTHDGGTQRRGSKGRSHRCGAAALARARLSAGGARLPRPRRAIAAAAAARAHYRRRRTLSLRVGVEVLEAIDEVGAVERVAADANDHRLAQALRAPRERRHTRRGGVQRVTTGAGAVRARGLRLAAADGGPPSRSGSPRARGACGGRAAPRAHLRSRLVDGLVCEGARARDDRNLTRAVDVARHDTNLTEGRLGRGRWGEGGGQRVRVVADEGGG